MPQYLLVRHERITPRCLCDFSALVGRIGRARLPSWKKKGFFSMNTRNFLIAATISVIALGLGACVGKAPGYGGGVGKAPPPVEAPIVRKG